MPVRREYQGWDAADALTPDVDVTIAYLTPSASRVIVAARIRRGASQAKARVASRACIPAPPLSATVAPVMRRAHMAQA